ncbi:ComEC/Rec2 family competence protein [Patescibacteria group bacterium]
MSKLVNSPSKILALALGLFCLGILLGPIFIWIPYNWLFFELLSGMVLLLLVQDKKARLVILFLTMLIFGIFRYGQSFPLPQTITVFDQINRSTRVSGVIDGEVEQRFFGQRIVIDQVRIADKLVFGKVQLYLSSYNDLAHGDTIIFECTLKKPEPIGAFNYPRYLSTQGILALCYHPQYLDVQKSDKFSVIGSVLSVKHFVVNRLALILPEPHASFVSGLLFGGSSSLSKDLSNDFSRTGTSHILAASGFNISLFSYIFLSWIIGTRLGRRKGIIVTGLLICAFVIMAGVTPAVLRAALMASLFLVAKWICRKPYLLNILLLTLSLMLFLNPQILLGDVGFQLSLVATVAVLYLAPLWIKKFEFIPKTFLLRESFVGSLAAICLTLPIVLWHFGSVSLVAPLVNLIVLPLIPYIMALGLFALSVSLLSVTVATIFALPTWALSSVILQVINLYASLSLASVSPTFSKGLALGVLLVLIILAVLFRLRSDNRKSKSGIIGIRIC